jgi:hypothetical protein
VFGSADLARRAATAGRKAADDRYASESVALAGRIAAAKARALSPSVVRKVSLFSLGRYPCSLRSTPVAPGVDRLILIQGLDDQLFSNNGHAIFDALAYGHGATTDAHPLLDRPLAAVTLDQDGLRAPAIDPAELHVFGLVANRDALDNLHR